MSLIYWICLVRRIPPSQVTPKLNCLQYFVIAALWGFDIAATMSEFQNKGFGGIPSSTQLFVSATIIACISTAFLYFGVRILCRLSEAAKVELARYIRPRFSSEPFAILADDRLYAPKPSSRVYKVLILTESVSIIAIAGQVRGHSNEFG